MKIWKVVSGQRWSMLQYGESIRKFRKMGIFNCYGASEVGDKMRGFEIFLNEARFTARHLAQIASKCERVMSRSM